MDKVESNDIVLITGKIKSIRYDREIMSQGNEVNIGGWNKVQLEDINPLIGKYTTSSDEIELKMTSTPTRDAYLNREIYALLRERSDGTFQALVWDYEDSGLCVPNDVAKAYAVEDDLMRLRHASEVNWKSSCGW